jgi:TPR repeat protein
MRFGTWLCFRVSMLLLLLAAGGLTGLAQDERGFAQSSTNAPTAYVNGRYYALVIGIDDYQPPMKKLKTAVNDAHSVGKILHERYGFEVRYLLDKDATRFNILDAMSKLRNSLNENDNLLIYFGGHGYYDHDADKAYWLPADADSGLSPNTIMADDLTSSVRALPSRHVLIISDSCYSGGLDRDADAPVSSGGQPAFLNRMLRSRSRTLMASGGNEPVSDAGQEGHSVFAYAVLEALREAESQQFTASDLFYTSIRQPVAGKSNQLPQYSILRNSNHDQGDFVFTLASAPAPPADVPTYAPTASAAPPKPTYIPKTASLPTPASSSSTIAALVKACASGDGAQCTDLGWDYESGKETEKDVVQAAIYYRKGCTAGNAVGCTDYGWMLEQGVGVGKSFTQAAIFYGKGCDGEDGRGCTDLGLLHELGEGFAKDPAVAAPLYRKGCDAGYASGCTDLGWLKEVGSGVDKDLTQAAVFYGKGCDGKDGRGCSNLGLLYELGNGKTKDAAQAAPLYRKSCDLGYANGCTDLGLLHEFGTGVSKDPAQAALFYGKGCDGGDGRGCTNLGLLHELGTGMAKNPAVAVPLYRKGCNDGYAGGCTDLGFMLESGSGTTKNLPDAANFYRKGCDGDDGRGCDNLALLYENGTGVPRDAKLAAEFHRKACSAGYESACAAVKK